MALDWVQFARFVVLSILTTPPNYQWQQILERLFPAYPHKAPISAGVTKDHDIEKDGGLPVGGSSQVESKPKLNLRNTFTKWFVDCITLGAILNTAAFLIGMGLMKGQSYAQIGESLRTVSDASGCKPS